MEPKTAATVTAAAVHAVSLKLPQFLAARPNVWFQQTEAQFALRGITDSTTKYFYLLTALDPVVAERMAGDVEAVPETNKYEYLKGKLMEVYGLTDDQKADKLLDLAGIGDWKPSQLCAYIQSLSVSKDALMRRIFLRQLPEDVRVQAAALDERDLPTLARKADVIMAAKCTPASINSSVKPPRRKTPPYSNRTTLCWYHAKFGDKAQSCRPPCTYSSSKQSSPGNDQAST